MEWYVVACLVAIALIATVVIVRRGRGRGSRPDTDR
jgi:hypothetical protein